MRSVTLSAARQWPVPLSAGGANGLLGTMTEMVVFVPLLATLPTPIVRSTKIASYLLSTPWGPGKAFSLKLARGTVRDLLSP